MTTILTESIYNSNSLTADFSALDIVNTAFAELGLPEATALIASSDALSVQGLRLLTSAARELLFAHPWQVLTRELTINFVNGQESYTLPQDLGYIIDRSWWDRTTRWPLSGPQTPTQWQALKGAVNISPLNKKFRIWQNKLWFYPTPSNTDQVNLEYVSRFWVVDAGFTLSKSGISSDTDVSMLDPILLIKYLKVKMQNAKGLDNTGVLQEFRTYFLDLIGKDVSAPALSISGGSDSIYLDGRNVPEGDWNA